MNLGLRGHLPASLLLSCVFYPEPHGKVKQECAFCRIFDIVTKKAQEIKIYGEFYNSQSIDFYFPITEKFPLYKDPEIGIYEYWQAPLIESKIDEDNDSDEEQINLAKKVCHLDLQEGIQYIQKNGIDDIMNQFQKENNKYLNKSISV